MKTIQIKNKYQYQLDLLVKVSGESQTRIINKVLLAGLIKISNQILESKNLEEFNNEQKKQKTQNHSSTR